MNNDNHLTGESPSDIEIAHNYREQLQQRAADDPGNPIGQLAMLDSQSQDGLNFIQEIAAHFGRLYPRLKIDGVVEEVAKAQSGGTLYDKSVFSQLTHRLSEEVAAEAHRQGKSLKGGVSVGVDYRAEAMASTSPTFGTTSSVVLLTAGFFDFCHVIAKLLARTFPAQVKSDGSIAVDHGQGAVRAKLESSKELQRAWLFVFQGKREQLGDWVEMPLGEEELPTYLNLLCAMEAFALAHEYGHHIANHSLGGVAIAGGVEAAQSFAEEFEADGQAVEITVGMPLLQNNLYGRYALGPIIFLVIRDIEARGRSMVETGKATNPDREHPPIQERVDAILEKVVKLLPANEHPVFALLAKNVLDSLTLIQEAFLGVIQSSCNPPR